MSIFGMLALSGCGSSGGGGGYGSPATGNTPQTYSIGGTINGLSASGLTIAYGSQTVSPATGAATFVFPTSLAAGTAYSVTVQSQPTGQTCLVTNGAGTVGSANVTTIGLSCNANNLNGTASAGTPIAGSAVILVDSNDRQVTTKTDSTGQFALSTVGLTAPFLVSVVTNAASPNGYAAGTTFYSVSDQATPTVINVTPLTDLLIRDWYAAQSTPITMATAFKDPASNAMPTPQEAQLLNAAILDIILPALQQQGNGPGGQDLVSTPFVANGQTFDAVLDEIQPITYDSTGTTTAVTINTTSTTTQHTTVTASAGRLQVATTTSDSASGVTGSNLTTAMIVTTSDQAAALAGVQTTLDRLSSVIQSKGSALQAADLAPFFDSNFLDGGLTATGEWPVLQALAGATITSDVVSRVKSFDGANNLLGVIPILDLTQNGNRSRSRLVYGSPDVGLIFKRESDGSWLLYGNQQEAYANVQYENLVSYYATGTQNQSQFLIVDVTVPATSMTPPCSSPYAGSVTVFPQATINAVGLAPVALTPSGYSLTAYGETNQQPFAYGTLACQFGVTNGGTMELNSADLPPLVGNTLNFSLNGGAPIPAVAQTIAGYTTEPLVFVTPSSHALSAAPSGQPLTIQWNPPTTVAVEHVYVSVIEAVDQFGGGQQYCSYSAIPFQLTGASSLTLTTLPTCNNSMPSTTTGPLPAVEITIGVLGSHGEYLAAIWAFN